MSLPELLGHEPVVDGFRRALARGRLASSYLFVGPEGVGKRTFALKLARNLLCERSNPADLAPCGECPSCQQVIAGTHPDIEIISLPEDKREIPVRLLIGDAARGRRNKEGFCFNLSRKPSRGGRKIGIIDDADRLNEEGANCLLKTLEEPPPRSLLILLSNNASSQLPTIRSRCQCMRFQSLPETHLRELIALTAEVENPERAEMLVGMEGVTLAESLLWAEDAFWNFRSELLDVLGRVPLPIDALTQVVQTFIDQEKTPIDRRKRMVLTFHLAAYFYRLLLRWSVGSDAHIQGGGSIDIDKTLARAVSTATHSLSRGDGNTIDSLTRMVDRSLAAGQQTSQNANASTVIGCWANDLSICFSLMV
ncbi:MAG: DNA polymerase III subunit delta' [Planctomycetaceae bacterium]|nr:DNA polymerase III subunit delta' [Planctomycetaceae bacterium]